MDLPVEKGIAYAKALKIRYALLFGRTYKMEIHRAKLPATLSLSHHITLPFAACACLVW